MTSYDSIRFDPPAPLALVVIKNPQNGKTVIDVPMLIDTGADLTLIPSSFVGPLELNKTGQLYELEGFDGKISYAEVIAVEICFEGRIFKGQFLLSTQSWGVVGRNILNLLTLSCDGPNQTWSIK